MTGTPDGSDDIPNPLITFNLGNVLYGLGHVPRAAERFRQAVELDRTFADAWNNLGNALAEIGEKEEALAALRTGLQLNPTSAEIHYNLADPWTRTETRDPREGFGKTSCGWRRPEAGRIMRGADWGDPIPGA